MTRSAADFAEAFADFWAAPDPDRLGDLLHDDVVLIQPLRAPIHGVVAAKEYFRTLIELRPGITGAVARHASADAADGEYLYLDWSLLMPIGGATRAIPAIDRFLLTEGRARERVAFIDVTPHIGPMLIHTPIWRWPAVLGHA